MEKSQISQIDESQKIAFLNSLGINEIIQQRIKLALHDFEELEKNVDNIPDLIKENFNLLSEALKVLPVAIDNKIADKIEQLLKILELGEKTLTQELEESKNLVLANFVADSSKMLTATITNHEKKLDELLSKQFELIKFEPIKNVTNKSKGKIFAWIWIIISFLSGAALSCSLTYVLMSNKLNDYASISVKSYNAATKAIELLPKEQQAKAKLEFENSLN